MRASGGADEAGPGDPWEVFSALALLVVEGRTPGGGRGYHAGPHCPQPCPSAHRGAPPHTCANDNPVCARACALLRQLRVMWGAGVGASIEVLVAPECEHGAQLAATLDTAAAPRPRLRLIEHWSFAVNHNRCGPTGLTGWAVVAAVRSFLHFSQLSAWLSRSEGRRPPNLLYRLTVTSPVFGSKFESKSEEHMFPLAGVGSQTSIQVSVKSLPRTDEIPIAICSERHGELLEASSPSSAPSTYHHHHHHSVQRHNQGPSHADPVASASVYSSSESSFFPAVADAAGGEGGNALGGNEQQRNRFIIPNYTSSSGKKSQSSVGFEIEAVVDEERDEVFNPPRPPSRVEVHSPTPPSQHSSASLLVPSTFVASETRSSFTSFQNVFQTESSPTTNSNYLRSPDTQSPLHFVPNPSLRDGATARTPPQHPPIHSSPMRQNLAQTSSSALTSFLQDSNGSANGSIGSSSCNAGWFREASGSANGSTNLSVSRVNWFKDSCTSSNGSGSSANGNANSLNGSTNLSGSTILPSGNVSWLKNTTCSKNGSNSSSSRCTNWLKDGSSFSNGNTLAGSPAIGILSSPDPSCSSSLSRAASLLPCGPHHFSSSVDTANAGQDSPRALFACSPPSSYQVPLPATAAKQSAVPPQPPPGICPSPVSSALPAQQSSPIPMSRVVSPPVSFKESSSVGHVSPSQTPMVQASSTQLHFSSSTDYTSFTDCSSSSPSSNSPSLSRSKQALFTDPLSSQFSSSSLTSPSMMPPSPPTSSSPATTSPSTITETSAFSPLLAISTSLHPPLTISSPSPATAISFPAHVTVASSSGIQVSSSSPPATCSSLLPDPTPAVTSRISYGTAPLQPAGDHAEPTAHTAARPPKNEELRVCVMRGQLEENSNSSRGSSPDLLGESLLDPPHASRIPRCYQSPSRSGSPSRETPEHIMCRPRHYSVSEIRITPTNSTANLNSGGLDLGPRRASRDQEGGDRTLQPQVVVGRTPTISAYNPMAWTQSRYPTGTAPPVYHLHQQTLHHQQYHPHHHIHHHQHHPSETSSHQAQVTSMQTSLPHQDQMPVRSPSQAVMQPDSRNEQHHQKDTRYSVQENLENLRNIQRNEEPPQSTNPFVQSSSQFLKRTESKLAGPPCDEATESCFDLKDQVNLKLDLLRGLSSGGVNDTMLPPEEWSPRSRDLLLQHIGGGGTKRKVDTWEDVPGNTANKGRRKDHHLVNCTSRNPGGNDEQSGSIGNGSGSFDLTPKETLEILSVLHQREPYRQRCGARQIHQGLKRARHFDEKNGSSAQHSQEPCPASFLPGDSLEQVQNGNNRGSLASPSKYGLSKYRSAAETNSDSEEEECREACERENYDASLDESLGDQVDLSASPTLADTVRNKMQVYCATSDSVSNVAKCTRNESSRNTHNGTSSNGVSRNDNNKLESSKSTESLNHQVAAIGERVRRTLNFDRDDYDSSSNGVNDSNGGGSVKRSHPQSNLLKSLMKRSYQVSSESSWSICKQAKADSNNEDITDYASPTANGNTTNAEKLFSSPTSNGSCEAATVAASFRPDSPGTLLGDAEVAQITADAICSPSGAIGIPTPPNSADNTAKSKMMRSSLDSAFHLKTGLPLTSSPAPLRKGGCRFDYDASLTSVAAIKRSTSFHSSAYHAGVALLRGAECECGDDALEGGGCGGGCRPALYSASAPATVTASNLLGTFEECVLHGRLEPVSTVHGFHAEIAASGAFCPEHAVKPVTVFFYTLCDNDHFSSPYMGHIGLEKKGYRVPSKGTVQVTLLNPLGTVVKMFVVMYDLSDMPPNSRTFLRQRTLNMPVGGSDQHPDAHQWLRYLIHLKFASSKSGKVYLHTDIRMLIFRKSDADAAAAMRPTGPPYELRSFTHGPSHPKYSPRK